MDTTIRRRTRATAFRAAGWLTVASMVGLSLLGPSAGIASATKPEMVTLCHAAGQAGTTKFETLTIPYNAAYGNANGNGGHFTESGTPQAGHEDDYLGACTSTDEFGSLVVTKALAGNLTGFSGGDFTFSVSCGEASYPPVTITLASGSQSAPAITDIPAGTDCTVTETSKPAAGTYGSWDSPAAGNATIVAGQPAAVTITNTRTYSPPTSSQFGSLVVTKALAGNLTGFSGGDFTFSVSCGEASYPPVTITLASGSQSAPAITDIPAGTDCTVTETSKPAAGTYGSWDSPAAGHATSSPASRPP